MPKQAIVLAEAVQPIAELQAEGLEDHCAGAIDGGVG